MNDKASNPVQGAIVLRVLAGLVCALAIGSVVGALHAAPVFKCVDAQGHVAFQDTSCPARAQQTRIELHAQPTIGDAHEVAVARARASDSHRARKTTRPRKHSVRRKRTKLKMSWECRAANGEVFYRHMHCPGSVPGDGVVRINYAKSGANPRSRRGHNAWSSVHVHGVRIPRAEACRRIHAAGAAGRDGHLRDATVSTYDHLMGRDPCIGV